VRTAILGGTLLVLGAIAILTGVLPAARALAVGERVWPILLFVVAITVLTELAADAGLFTVVAEQLALWGINRAWMLWVLVVLLATASTVFLSLDTTAVLLTPVVIAVARHVGLPPMPFALTTVWLANSASLLLPVSNLTNLLAEREIGGGSPLRFAALMAVPAIVAVVIPALVLFVVYRRALVARFEPSARSVQDDRVLLIAAGVVVALLIPALVSGIAVWVPAVIGALVLGGFFVARRRASIRFALVPWRLALLASGLFLVVEAAHSLGLTTLLGGVVGSGDSPLALLRVSGAGAAGANLINNLPAYLALEPTGGTPLRLAALLIGVNAGALITPWASLATLLWHDRLASLDVSISWWRYVALGLIVVPLTIVPAVLALAWLG
jgi:Na+/H+ antiporter NhaD/arsenite permease-like protein